MEGDGSCQRLAATIKATISTSSPQFSAQYCCIYRVPPLLRQRNEQAYTPAVVSIGPLHHNDKKLLPMEPHKLSYLRSFLRHSPPNMDLSSYLRIIKDRETDIRRCYADDPNDLSSDEFIKMVLIDSVFIIELFRRYFYPSLIEVDDYLFRRPNIRETVLRDIKLEENQLPFFVLVRLYMAAFKSDANFDRVLPFTDIACWLLKLQKTKINVDAITKEATSCCHLLDLLRSNYKPSDLRTDGDMDPNHVSIDINSPVCPTVTSLFSAGVRFEVVSLDQTSSNLLNICLDKEKGILKIPKLEVDDNTESLFGNLIAFEQCHCRPNVTYFTNYHCFLDWLIDTPEDVQVLAKAGIIENWLGSNKQVSDLINSLGDNTSTSMEYYTYKEITQQLISHCSKRWNRHRATLKQTYFQHPWAAMSVIYAIILLLLTVIQVVAGILAIPHVLKGN